MWDGQVDANDPEAGFPLDMAKSDVLLTNDDGIDAPGLLALEAATQGFVNRRVVAAPLGAYSGCGHTVTTHKAIAIHSRGVDRFAIDGSPADCVRLAVHHLVPELYLVISGINAGGNLGGDVQHSGTVAAAREAASHGVAAIAISQYIARDRAVDWDRAARWTTRVLERLLAIPWELGTYWNVNLPHPSSGDCEPEIVFCPLDVSPMPIAYQIDEDGRSARFRGDYHGRVRKPGGDIDVCFGGRIAISRLVIGAG